MKHLFFTFLSLIGLIMAREQMFVYAEIEIKVIIWIFAIMLICNFYKFYKGVF